MTTEQVTYVIPVSPEHKQLAQRALQSVQQQTQASRWLIATDDKKQGPAYVRNTLLKMVRTPFVVFLDADDYVEPTFTEDTLREFNALRGEKYIFTDWYDADGAVVHAPCVNGGVDGKPVSVPGQRPYCGGTWHVITTLLPTKWVRDVGGFDEALPAVEDTDFYLKMCITAHCGHHLAKPLFHYTPNGGRSTSFFQSPTYQRVMGEMTLKYGGRKSMCCGSDDTPVPPIGQKQNGDVTAMALWQGNRTEYGRATGRMYSRISYPKTTWVDPRDVEASPQFWRKVEQPKAIEPSLEQYVPYQSNVSTLAHMAGIGLNAMQEQVAEQKYASPLVQKLSQMSAPASLGPVVLPEVKKTPDVARVLQMARSHTPTSNEPVFVFDDDPFPSYTTIRKLVALAGFKTIPLSKVDVFNRQPLVVVSPNPIPDFAGVPARVIAWQLEYTGDYSHNYDSFHGEKWSSDAEWARVNNAKYVTLGSDPSLLNPQGGRLGASYDVTMLGYMVQRRQFIKSELNTCALRWPEDYPGHDGDKLANVLCNTRLMLHVHQWNNYYFSAPQRYALAAAYGMPVLSESLYDPADLERHIAFVGYGAIADTVCSTFASGKAVKGLVTYGERLHQYLCYERPFKKCVLEALKS